MVYRDTVILGVSLVTVDKQILKCFPQIAMALLNDRRINKLLMHFVLIWIVPLVLPLWFSHGQAGEPAAAIESPVTVEQIVAVVNNKIVFLSDIRRDDLFFENENRSTQEKIAKRVEHQLLLHEAKRFVLDPPAAEEINQTIDNIKQRFKNEGAFLSALREAGMSLESFRSEVSDRVWIKTLLRDRIRFFIFVTGEEQERYDQQHPDLFKGVELEGRREKIRLLLEAEKEKIKTEEYIAQLKSKATVLINIR
jgi:hypothetical protein